MKPLRLAYISADPGIPVFGSKGASVHVQEVVRALLQRGVEVVLFTPRLGGEAPADLASVRTVLLPAAPKGELAAREQALMGANDDLRRALENEGPFDAVYERYSLWSHAGMAAAARWGVPGLLEVNAPLIEEQRAHRGLAHLGEARASAEFTFGAASALLPVSNEVADYLRSYTGTARKIRVTPNGVDPDRFSPPHADPSAFTVGFVGTLKPWHGVELLLEAFALLADTLPQARLRIIGMGPEREQLEAETARRGLRSRVLFIGAVAPSAIPAHLAQLDVAVAPYPALNGFYFSPLKVYEYMAASLPVVASRVGQLRDLLEDDVTGLLYPPGDSAALAEALRRLAQDAALRERLGARARATVLARHTWGAVAERILDLAQPVEVR